MQSVSGENMGIALAKLAEEDPSICAITAAMPGGTGLLEFKKRFPKRIFDVGIAEEHAMSMAGGLSKQGMIPVVALYSTFLQRAYDMILQDICMLNLHVVIAVDRAGLVGEDGETHHGVFDVGFLRQIPNMQILCPSNTAELQKMLHWAVKEQSGPVAIRYPRGCDGSYTDSKWNPASSVVCCRDGKECAIVTYGNLVNNALAAADILSQIGIESKVIRLTQIAPLAIDVLASQLSEYRCVTVIEETCDGSGIYSDLAWELRSLMPNCKFTHLDLGHQYVTHGAVDALYKYYGLDASGIAAHIQEVLDS